MNRLPHDKLSEYIRTIDAKDYASTRNYIGHSTRLSEYITRGVISLPKVKALILENNTESAAYKLINELTWREYWQHVWRVRGDDIFGYIRPQTRTVRPGIPVAVLTATTGIEALDAGIRELKETGYIHNHMRMWIAGLVCNVAQCDWKTGAAWMHSYLIDGDYASNHLSWQWVAGCYTGKPYLPQQENINTYTKSEQHGTYIDVPYSEIATMPVPDQLQDITTQIPPHESRLPASTTDLKALAASSDILLYSPWTLDPGWHSEADATRLLLIDSDDFLAGRYSQNVLDSINWFADQIPGLEVLVAKASALQDLTASLYRKSYPGISSWPGEIEPPELLFPDIPEIFYPSFSAFWKQAQC